MAIRTSFSLTTAVLALAFAIQGHGCGSRCPDRIRPAEGRYVVVDSSDQALAGAILDVSAMEPDSGEVRFTFEYMAGDDLVVVVYVWQ
jgi:hypothetical protein